MSSSTIPSAHCTVLLLDRELGVLRHGASPTLPDAFSSQIDGLPVAEGMGACGTAAARGEVVVVRDVLADPMTSPFSDLAHRFNLVSIWSHPLLRAGGEVLGTFAVYRHEPHTPRGGGARVRVEDRRPRGAGGRPRPLRAALQLAANFDSLTGLPNRARFLETVNAELNTLGLSVTVMMVEVDRFGQLNQSLGHIAGDRLLVEIGERLREALGEDGMVARFASDVFTLMAPALDARALRRAHRLA